MSTASSDAPATTVSIAPPLIAVKNLSAHYPVKRGVFGAPRLWHKAVDDVSFEIRQGETFGLVGESGCGKTTLGRTILALRNATSGDVEFGGRSVFARGPTDSKAMRRDMQLIFQDPYASLDPRRTVGGCVRAALDIHGIGDKSDREDMVAEIFSRVGLHRSYLTRFPHEFSGGQRQRIGIARALVLRPKFVVCDEPASALDVSIQAQILNLLRDLQDDFGLTYLFISHNLAVVEHMSNRVAVMYYGKIVEIADRDQLFANPRHPYTRTLLSAAPSPDPGARTIGVGVAGDPPGLEVLSTGCRFRNRCPSAMERCEKAEPALVRLRDDHEAACWLDQ